MTERIEKFLRWHPSKGFNAGWLENVKADIRYLIAENDELRAEIARMAELDKAPVRRKKVA